MADAERSLTGALRASQNAAGARPPPSRSLHVRRRRHRTTWTSPDDRTASRRTYTIYEVSRHPSTRAADRHRVLPVPSTRSGTAPSPSPTVGMTRGELDTPALLLDLDRFEANVRPPVDRHRGGRQGLAPPLQGPQVALDRPPPDGASVPSASPAPRSPRPRSWSTAASRPSSSPTSLRPGSRSSGRHVSRTAPRSSSAPTTRSTSGWHPRSATDRRRRDPDGRRHQRRHGPDRRRCRVDRRSSSRGAIDRAPGVRLAGIMGYEGHALTAWPNEEKRAETDRRGRRPDRVAPPDRGRRHAGRDRQRRRLGQPHVRRVARRPDRAAGRGRLPHGPVLRRAVPPRGARLRVRADDPDDGRPAGRRPSGSSPTPASRRCRPSEAWHASRPRARPDFELVYLSAEHGVWRRPPDGPRTWSSVTVSRSSRTTTTRRRSGTTQFVGLRDGVVETIIPLLARGKLS